VLFLVPLARPRALVAAPEGSLDAPLGPCEVTSPVPERVVLECQAAAAGEAVLLDAPAPGWSAELDGRPAPLRGRAGTFRAVSLPAGAHRVVLTYRTPWLRVGAVVALLSWLGLGLVLRRARPAPT
jgi:uncharacterized membrane protein YfhO